MAINIEERHLFKLLLLVVALTAFLVEPSYFMTAIILIGITYFILKTKKLKYLLLILLIILAIFVSLLIAS